VQRTAITALDGGPDFKTAIGQIPEVRERLNERELAELFDPAFYLRHIDVTFERLGLEPAPVAVRTS
jgi:adenylosuccinate lyase